MDDLEREYSPSSRVGGSAEPFIADYERRSAAAAGELGDACVTTGGGSLVVAAAPGSPLLVFVHGGYWQALSAADSLYLAPAARRLGWSYAALEYTIAPAGTIPQMVAECCRELADVVARTAPSSVVVAGHSAGAHLTAMVAVVEAAPCRVDRVVLVSGVYDLRPLVRTTTDDALGLDDRAAAAISPALLPVAGTPEVVVAWGDDDTRAFAAQSESYAATLRDAGLAVDAFECAGRHHFDIVDDLVDPATRLGAATLGLGPTG